MNILCLLALSQLHLVSLEIGEALLLSLESGSDQLEFILGLAEKFGVGDLLLTSDLLRPLQLLLGGPFILESKLVFLLEIHCLLPGLE